MTTSQRQTSQWPYVTVFPRREKTDSDVSIYLVPRRVYNSFMSPWRVAYIYGNMPEVNAMALNGQKNLLVTVH